MKKERGEDKDMLSKLPEEILNRVLCFFPQKEAVRTCLLSKSWRYRGSTRFKLELSEVDDFDRDNGKFVSVLDNSLQRYHDQNLAMKQLVLKMYPTSKAKYDLNSIALKFQFIEELCLEGCDLRHTNSTPRSNLSFKNLRKLSLRRVCIADLDLEMLLSTHCCHLIEYLELFVMEELAPTGVIRIQNWPFPDRYFPRLKYLNLRYVQLSTDSFDLFTSSYMPSLEEIHLADCSGLEEFRLSNPSIKYIYILDFSDLVEATIDSPSIIYFEFRFPYLSRLPSISFAPTSREWKSNLSLSFATCNSNHQLLQRNIALNELLKALSQSQITLKLVDCSGYYIEDPSQSGFNEPLIAVEHFHLLGNYYSYPALQVIFSSWFRAFRPRHIYDVYNQDMRVFKIIWGVLVNDYESSWNQELVDVSLETSYGNLKEWHPFSGNRFSRSELANNQTVRLRLKWRDSS